MSRDFLGEQWTNSSLNRFITEHLDVNEAFAKQAKGVLSRLVSFLQHESNLEIGESIKGGSLGKGTAIRGKADIDVVLFVNDFRDMNHFLNGLNEVLVNMEQKLRKSQMYQSNNLELCGRTRHAVTFRLRENSQSDYFDVDLLPAFDNLGNKSKKDVYNEMKVALPSNRYYYSSSFVTLQRDFVKEKPVLVKQLIRLIKYWNKTYFQGSARNRRLTSYLLELIAIDVWEKEGGRQSFDMKLMFEKVLRTLTEPERIEACWNVNYDSSEFRTYLGQDRPFVLDPANPFNNIASGCDATGWSEVAGIAGTSLKRPLFN